MTQQAITLAETSHIPAAFIPPPQLMLARQQQSAPTRRKVDQLKASLIASASLSTISRTV